MQGNRWSKSYLAEPQIQTKAVLRQWGCSEPRGIIQNN